MLERFASAPLALALLFVSWFCLAGVSVAQQAEAPAATAPESSNADGAESERRLDYTVEVVPTEDSRLNQAAEAVSQLVQLRERAPTSAFGVIGRAQADVARLQDALRSEGYYAGDVRIEVAGVPIATPGMGARLEAATEPVPIRIILEPGPRYEVSQVKVDAQPASAAPVVATATEEPFGLAVGDPARAGAVLDAGDTLVERLRQAGHPLAELTRRSVVVDHDQRTMEVTYVLAPGPRAAFAPPTVVGQNRVETGLLERVAGRRLTGEIYSPRQVERARRAVLDLGVFDSVRAQPAEALDDQGRLPVTFVVSERPRRAVGVSAAYETNYGFTGSVYWEHRNLFGGAERLRLEAEVSRIGEGGPLDDTNYSVFATLRTPEVLRRDVQLVARVGAVRERLEAYDRNAVIVSALFEHRLTDNLVLQAGPSFEAGEVGRDDVLSPFELLGFTLGARYDTTDNLLDPRRGVRLALTATPFYSLRDTNSFTRLLGVGTTYWDVAGTGRSILALRGVLGSIFGADRDDVPLDKRFYAGGGGSVRGFDYQSIGPRDALRRPLGGTSLVEASIEWRQRIGGSFGAVAFVDAGSVGQSEAPDFSDVRVGIGLGLRYFTAIGPLRADIAVPINREPGDSGYGLYVGLGQAF